MNAAHPRAPITHRVIDGNNVMGSRPDGWWRDRAAAQARLVSLLARHAVDSGEQVTVFFDGAPVALPASNTGVTVHFAKSAAHAADDAIVQWLGRRSDRAAVCVVSSDAGLGQRVTELGVAVEGAATFRRRLEGPRRPKRRG